MCVEHICNASRAVHICLQVLCAGCHNLMGLAAAVKQVSQQRSKRYGFLIGIGDVLYDNAGAGLKHTNVCNASCILRHGWQCKGVTAVAKKTHGYVTQQCHNKHG